ncbi:MAG: twin-arginine translocase TatA/TatE family subunit [Chloroflexi bacterium]|nr:MAG: twin-arginine translocase TatA/TatE family subunit [Chloroflexota bacterium]
MQFGPLELGIILVIVILLFGVGRIGKIAGELGSGVRSFRQGLKGPEEEKKETLTSADGQGNDKSQDA